MIDAVAHCVVSLQLLHRDHPEIVTVPETTYLKGALLQAVD